LGVARTTFGIHPVKNGAFKILIRAGNNRDTAMDNERFKKFKTSGD